MKTLFKLTMPGDCESRSSSTIGFFASEELARNIARTGHGNMLMGPNEGQIYTLHAFETAEEFYEHTPAADPTKYPEPLDIPAILRRRALAKLSPEEQEALGLKS